jgi:predicted nucleic acid-binding protein
MPRPFSRFSMRSIRAPTVASDFPDVGQIVARPEAIGRPINAMDAFIAATAHVHGLTLVKRPGFRIVGDHDYESGV